MPLPAMCSHLTGMNLRCGTARFTLICGAPRAVRKDAAAGDGSAGFARSPFCIHSGARASALADFITNGHFFSNLKKARGVALTRRAKLAYNHEPL